MLHYAQRRVPRGDFRDLFIHEPPPFIVDKNSGSLNASKDILLWLYIEREEQRSAAAVVVAAKAPEMASFRGSASGAVLLPLAARRWGPESGAVRLPLTAGRLGPKSGAANCRGRRVLPQGAAAKRRHLRTRRTRRIRAAKNT